MSRATRREERQQKEHDKNAKSDAELQEIRELLQKAARRRGNQ